VPSVRRQAVARPGGDDPLSPLRIGNLNQAMTFSKENHHRDTEITEK